MEQDSVLQKFNQQYTGEDDGFPKKGINRAIGANYPDKNLTRYDGANAFIKENPKKLNLMNSIASGVYKEMRDNNEIICDDNQNSNLIEDIKYLRDENQTLRERIEKLTVNDETDLGSMEGYESVINDLKKRLAKLQESLDNSKRMTLHYRNYIQNCINGAYNQVLLDSLCKQTTDATLAQADLISTLNIFYENAKKLHMFAYLVKDAKDVGTIKIEQNEDDINQANTPEEEKFDFEKEFKKIEYMFDNGTFTTEQEQ